MTGAPERGWRLSFFVRRLCPFRPGVLSVCARQKSVFVGLGFFWGFFGGCFFLAPVNLVGDTEPVGDGRIPLRNSELGRLGRLPGKCFFSFFPFQDEWSTLNVDVGRSLMSVLNGTDPTVHWGRERETEFNFFSRHDGMLQKAGRGGDKEGGSGEGSQENVKRRQYPRSQTEGFGEQGSRGNIIFQKSFLIYIYYTEWTDDDDL